MRFLDKQLVNQATEWSISNLKKTLIKRDESLEFNFDFWNKAQSELLMPIQSEYFSSDKFKCLASVFYGLAKGSYDIPFCSSLAAHSVISTDLFNMFATNEQKEIFGKHFSRCESITAICNSEDGAGSDLKRMKSKAIIQNDGNAIINLLKPCSTNASHAQLLMCSVWIQNQQNKPTLGIVLLKNDEVRAQEIQSKLSGFRTGLTGQVMAQDLKIDFKERSMNLTTGSNQIFKRCFDTERLFIAVMVSGILESIEVEMIEQIHLKESSGFTLSDKQYLQEKLTQIYSNKTYINAILESVFTSNLLDLNSSTKELALLKILVNQNALESIVQFYEFIGHRGYMKDQFCQKLIRDFLGLRYFGGTTELQKNSLYFDLTKKISKTASNKAA